MKRIRVNNTQETLILTGMIISDRFLKEVIGIMDRRLFKSSYSKKIASWCVDFFNENKQAPGKHIQDIFNYKMENKLIETDEANMIGKTLDRISKEYQKNDKFNDQVVLKLAEKYFDKARIKKLNEQVNELIDTDPLQARDLLLKYQPKIIQATKGYDVLNDRDLLLRSFEQSEKPLFQMPGALGQLVNDDLKRGAFVALMGQEKIGKTWNLMEFAIQSVRNRLNTLFIQAGDMTDEQQALRMAIRVSGRSNKSKFSGKLLIPTYDCVHNQTGSCDIRKRASEVDLGVDDYMDLLAQLGVDKDAKWEFFKTNDLNGYKPCEYCRRKYPKNYRGSIWYNEEVKKQLTFREALVANRKFHRRFLSKKRMRLISYPNNTLTTNMICNYVDSLIANEGWVPDVIINDYADLHTTEDKMEGRDQSNHIWKSKRAISQIYNCLYLTATQADADAYGKPTLTLKNFSEDKRKYSHATSIITLNQTVEEKLAGIMRYVKLLSRDDDFDSRFQVKVMQNYSIGRANLGSFV